MGGDLLDALGRADDEQIAKAEKQAGLEDSDNGLKAGVELLRIADLGEVAINDGVAAVGQIRFAARQRANPGRPRPCIAADARCASGRCG